MTSGKTATVLLIEDTPSLSAVYLEYLKKEGIGAELAETGADGVAALERGAHQVILLDLQLPDMDGSDILKMVQTRGLSCSVVVITSNASINTAVQAMRFGAYDFIVKPFTSDRLLTTVRNAMERAELKRVVETMRDDLGRERYYGFIGSSLPMQAVYRAIDSVARSKAPVFITGESGTGKEVCAEAIHRASPRNEGPFVPLNCGAIPKDLIESELFGHLKGAFTGAISDRDGAATQADGGTLFLDEICEMDLALQTKLLRFLQTGTIQRVGGTKPEKVDIRVICATNRDPLQEVEAGRFREDLYYRLHVVPIHLPPLRERDDDVIELAQHFLVNYAEEEGKSFRRFEDRPEERLRSYDWPGNIRQLQNVVRQIVVMHDGESVELEMLPPPVHEDGERGGQAGQDVLSEPPAAMDMGGFARREREPAASRAPGDQPRRLWEIEKEAIEAAIADCGGSIPKAAEQLGISPSTIYRKKESWRAEGKEGGSDLAAAS